MSPLAFGLGKSRGALFDPAAFYSNYIVLYFNWTDGKDLDIITSFISPNLSGECGFNRSPGNAITNGDGSITYMKWGNDNSEDTEGYEGIYIDVEALKQVPGGLTNNEIELDLRCIWRAEVGIDPVILTATGYQGGTMQLESETPNVPGYGFLNTTASQTFINFKESKGKQITDTDRENNGQRVARVKLKLSEFVLEFVEDD